jgi:hypothetical protein
VKGCGEGKSGSGKNRLPSPHNWQNGLKRIVQRLQRSGYGQSIKGGIYLAESLKSLIVFRQE